jgi:hypothetical protein
MENTLELLEDTIKYLKENYPEMPNHIFENLDKIKLELKHTESIFKISEKIMGKGKKVKSKDIFDALSSLKDDKETPFLDIDWVKKKFMKK